MYKISSAVPVDKSFIGNYSFPKEELVSSDEEKADLLIKLHVATVLGNMEKIKCKIFFKDSKGVKVVETTIWATCEKNVQIKGGVSIPIRRILDVVI